MISSNKFKVIKNHILFLTNLVIIINLVNYYLVDEELFDKSWLYSSYGIILAYIIYLLLDNTEVNINDKDYLIKKSKYDAIRYFILFTLSHIIINFFKDGNVKISFLWFFEIILTITMYISFDYFLCDYSTNEISLIFLNVVKIFIAEILGLLIIFQKINLVDISDLLAYIIAYLVWYLIIKKFIL